MAHRNIIDSPSEEEVWQIIADQLNNKKDNLDFSAQFSTQQRCVTLDIDISPERGEDDEPPLTSFCAELPEETSFRFTIERQGLKHELAKLFGMQDVTIGHAAFDKQFLIQTNDAEKVKAVFSNPEIVEELLRHPVNNLKIRERKIGVTRDIVLDLCIDGGITEPPILQRLFRSFKEVLTNLA